MKTNRTILFFSLISIEFLVTLLFFVAPTISSSNDSVARVATGGITFLKSEDIAMLQETLEISTDKIKVHYRFMNESDQDIKTTVAFPMPEFGWDPESNQSNISLRRFKTVVNGRAVETKIIRRAVINGGDITNKLRKIGLSDKQIFETFGCEDYEQKEQCAYSKYQVSELKKLSAINVENGFPLWKVQETAIWEQKFSAGKELVIEHKYKPFDGGYYSVPYQGEYKYLDLNSIPTAGTSLKNEACFGIDTRLAVGNQIKAAVNKKAKKVYVVLTDIEYVLGTGRNWKGPIKDFRLIIKKKSPSDVVSLCFPGKPQKIDATTIEFSQKDYVPQDKLVVYFYSVQGR